MNEHRQVFNQLFLASGYSAKEVSRWSGIHESKLSRFRSGKLDLEAGEFFHLLGCFPREFQERFWVRFRNVDGNWRSVVKALDVQELSQLLHLVADQLKSSESTEALQVMAKI
jgi:hypothetical protein